MNLILTHPWTITLRNRLRHNRVARYAYERWMGAHSYEEAFGEQLLSAIDARSVVWDVGANIGLYTERFLARNAETVVCWEPAPAAAGGLRKRFGAGSGREDRVQIVQAALSHTNGTARFSADGDSVTNRLVSGSNPADHEVDVQVLRADYAVRSRLVPAPTVVKIDVEGFELDVLHGFGTLLGSRELRAVFVEVHFTRLHERGMDYAPKAIQQLLIGSGFDVSWLDLSHVAGLRS
jgi:FkbM family methyltransferase